MKSFIFNLRTKIIVGKNSINEIPAELDKLGVNKVFIVTDKIISEKTDIIKRIKEVLDGRKKYVVFDDVKPDSECSIVDRAFEIAKSESVDGLLSVGGGSSIDTAKAVAILFEKGGNIKDHTGVYILTKPTLPHIAVPTTAGTGSEVSHVAVIKDEKEGRKLVYVDWYIMPQAAILDPTLTVSMPPSVTAHTGMDALTHCIEAIHSTENNPVSDAFAMHGIRLIKENLPRAIENPQDLEARQNMQVAAMMGGAAFTNAQVGIVHAIAHSIGAMYGIPHGLANSLILPYGMMFNLPECPRYKLVAEAFGLSDADEKKLARKAIDEVLKFIERLGLPKTLKEVGVKKEDFPKIAELAIGDPSIISNPRFAIMPEAILEVLENAYEGKI
jgi:alcohol dehydrogenase